MPIFRRKECIHTASGIFALCKRLQNTTSALYSRSQKVTIPDAVIIQFDLLKMSIVLLEKCRGL